MTYATQRGEMTASFDRRPNAGIAVNPTPISSISGTAANLQGWPSTKPNSTEPHVCRSSKPRKPTT